MAGKVRSREGVEVRVCRVWAITTSVPPVSLSFACTGSLVGEDCCDSESPRKSTAVDGRLPAATAAATASRRFSSRRMPAVTERSPARPSRASTRDCFGGVQKK